jgi:hypothetical protein
MEGEREGEGIRHPSSFNVRVKAEADKLHNDNRFQGCHADDGSMSLNTNLFP